MCGTHTVHVHFNFYSASKSDKRNDNYMIFPTEDKLDQCKQVDFSFHL